MCESSVRNIHFQESSNTTNKNHDRQSFKVTHPHHPLVGQEFELLTYRNNWGENRVYYYDDRGELCNLPANWTDIEPEDPFVKLSQGQSYFRVVDLISLTKLISYLQERDKKM